MLKKIIISVLALLTVAVPAFAIIMDGTTAAYRSVPVSAEANGVLKILNAQPGMVVAEGDLIGATEITNVYADRDGTISILEVEEGDTVSGEVLKLSPLRRYTIYCTAEEAYEEPENQLVHLGNTVYISCTKDGSHRGIGIVTKINDEEYRVETIGGELYVGEVVYLYRSNSFLKKDRIGIGTVIATLEETYEASGRITRIDVEQGEFVQRGELLFSYVSDRASDIIVPVSGIITEVDVMRGDGVSYGQTVAKIVPFEAICIVVEPDESDIARVDYDAIVTFTMKNDPMETTYTGKILQSSGLSNGENYKVYIHPDQPIKFIGLSVEVDLPMR